MASDAFKMIDFLNDQLEHHLSETSDVEMASGSEPDPASEQEGEAESVEEETNLDDGEEGMAVGTSSPGRTDLSQNRMVKLAKYSTDARGKLEVRGDGTRYERIGGQHMNASLL